MTIIQYVTAVYILTHFKEMFHFYAPEKCQKTKVAQRFSDVFRGYGNGTGLTCVKFICACACVFVCVSVFNQ